jgi:hypothetical protein
MSSCRRAWVFVSRLGLVRRRCFRTLIPDAVSAGVRTCQRDVRPVGGSRAARDGHDPLHDGLEIPPAASSGPCPILGSSNPGLASRRPSTVREGAVLDSLRPQLYDKRTVWSATTLFAHRDRHDSSNRCRQEATMRSFRTRRRHPLAAASTTMEHLVLRHFGLQLTRHETKDPPPHTGGTPSAPHLGVGSRTA